MPNSFVDFWYVSKHEGLSKAIEGMCYGEGSINLVTYVERMLRFMRITLVFQQIYVSTQKKMTYANIYPPLFWKFDVSEMIEQDKPRLTPPAFDIDRIACMMTY